MIRAKVFRTYSDKQTLGFMKVFDSDDKLIFECKTLECPWDDNKTRKSCIPEGTYKVKYHNSPSFKRVCPWLQGTEPRTWILIHPGNTVYDIRGCILVGTGYGDINNDGLTDVISSKVAFNNLMKVLDGKPFEIELLEYKEK